MLPTEFTDRMKLLLGDEFTAFMEALGRPPVKGIRVNRHKTTPEVLSRIFPARLTELSYVRDGYIPDMESGLGALAEHHAGMFYSQDPGAMATLAAPEIKEGYTVLDACAAPGGKSTQVADLIGEGGFILSNEFVPKRAKVLVGNLERMGLRNAMVTSMDTAELGRMYRGVFDLVICDAPCSGEGMFRKCDEAVTDWSEENVRACALRQGDILDNCAPTVKGGGYLLYSTCTYSTEENEETVRAFIMRHPEFTIVPVLKELCAITSDGIDVREDMEDLKLTRRFYPHVSKGEGQYIALLQKAEKSGDMPTILYKDASKPLTKSEISIVDKFMKDNMTVIPRGRYIKVGDGIAILTHDMPVPSHSVFMSGVMVGSIKGTNLFPHHHFFSSYGRDMKNKLELTRGDIRVEKYLRGEEILCDGGSGWCAVCYEGAVIGGGKISDGRVKNHYPKGLRTH